MKDDVNDDEKARQRELRRAKNENVILGSVLNELDEREQINNSEQEKPNVDEETEKTGKITGENVNNVFAKETIGSEQSEAQPKKHKTMIRVPELVSNADLKTLTYVLSWIKILTRDFTVNSSAKKLEWESLPREKLMLGNSCCFTEVKK